MSARTSTGATMSGKERGENVGDPCIVETNKSCWTDIVASSNASTMLASKI